MSHHPFLLPLVLVLRPRLQTLHSVILSVMLVFIFPPFSSLESICSLSIQSVIHPSYQYFSCSINCFVRSLFPYKEFNKVQSFLFPLIVQSTKNLIISAPTVFWYSNNIIQQGCGKTVLFELDIMRIHQSSLYSLLSTIKIIEITTNPLIVFFPAIWDSQSCYSSIFAPQKPYAMNDIKIGPSNTVIPSCLFRLLYILFIFFILQELNSDNNEPGMKTTPEK